MLGGCFNPNSRSWGKPMFILPKSKEGDRSEVKLSDRPLGADESQARFFTLPVPYRRVRFCLDKRVMAGHVFWGLSFLS